MKCVKKWILLTVCLLIFLPNFATAQVAKWWCPMGNTGKIVECERNSDGIITPTSVEYLIYRYFSDDFDNAIKVAKCESNFNNSAIGKVGEVGVFQIHPVHFKEVENLGLDLRNTEMNIIFARLLYAKQGWKPWSCSRIVGIDN